MQTPERPLAAAAFDVIDIDPVPEIPRTTEKTP